MAQRRTSGQAGAARNVGRALIAAAVLAGIGGARAADALLPDLEQRLAHGGADAVNAHLVAHWPGAMVPLGRRTAACELHAVSLTVRLARSRNARAVQVHREALRSASGDCARFVLAMATLTEVPTYCGSLSAWGPAQTARELRRRIADIDTDELLRASQRGRTCRAAYVYELENTRVVVRRSAPRPAAR
ncbi:MAG TPA: hypothetical protein VFZ28_12720 [Burkholderiaceae bacterium]|nr:hypothetical protein [Burkholderiaceae bacterium]